MKMNNSIKINKIDENVNLNLSAFSIILNYICTCDNHTNKPLNTDIDGNNNNYYND